MKIKSIVWTKDAEDSFNEILEYIISKSGQTMAQKIYEKIIIKIELFITASIEGKVVQDLKDIGIEIHEIVESPWRIFYRVQDNVVYILSVLDGRRNIHEILISRVLEQ